MAAARKSAPLIHMKALQEMAILDTNGALSRRALLKSAAIGAVSLATLGLLPPESARADLWTPFARTGRRSQNEASGVHEASGVVYQRSPAAVGGGASGNLAAVQAALYGTGLFVGNNGDGLTDAQWLAKFTQVANWGFDFICPKVGGYGSTWYSDYTQLLNWKAMANSVGLQYAPFIYSVPNSAVSDARICSQIANNCGIAIVDMEDEWAGYNTAMTTFGSTYRKYSPDVPILVSGYGDPISRFGSVTAWPNAQMAAWADAYSPQWYFGVWGPYGGHANNVKAAINWGDGQCATAYGNSFPLVPEFDFASAYSSNSRLPAGDVVTAQNYGKLWKAPVFWWYDGYMTNAYATAILPQDVSSSVRVDAGEMWYTPVGKQYLQTVTLTNIGGSALTGPLNVGVTGLPSYVKLTSPSGMHQLNPYVTATASALGAGASVSMQLRFTPTSPARFRYGTKVYSGPALPTP